MGALRIRTQRPMRDTTDCVEPGDLGEAALAGGDVFGAGVVEDFLNEGVEQKEKQGQERGSFGGIALPCPRIRTWGTHLLGQVEKQQIPAG